MKTQSNVQKIVSKIEEEAEEEADEILSKTKKKAQKIKEKAKEDAEKEKEEIVNEGEKKALQQKDRIIADAKLRAKRKKLEAREKVIEQSINKAENEITDFNDEEKMEVIKNLLKQSVREIKESKIIIQTNDEDKKLIKKNKEELENSIEEIVENPMLEIGESIPIRGGIIVSNEDETMQVNNSIEARLSREREKIRKKANEILFD